MIKILSITGLSAKKLLAHFMILFVMLGMGSLRAQSISPIQEVEMQVDTNIYLWTKDTIIDQNGPALAFEFKDVQPVAQVKLRTAGEVPGILLAPSADYRVIDSLLWFGDHYRFKVQFNNLIETRFLDFTFLIEDEDNTGARSISLFPYRNTEVQFRPQNTEMYIGEEKVFDLMCNDPQNLLLDNQWRTIDGMEYRVSRQGGSPKIHIVPNKLGPVQLQAALRTIRPNLSEDRQPVYELPVVEQMFFIKASRLAFLDVNINEIVKNEDSGLEPVEIQLQDHRNLKIGKTYRLERQSEPGGAIIAEIHTRSRLSNNQVLSTLRVYNYHDKSDGYLYMKDGDDPAFITNFNIIHRTEITDISVLTSRGKWRSTRKINPGQSIDLKIEGYGMENAPLIFEGVQTIDFDSLTGTNEVSYYRIDIPMDIKRKTIRIFQNGEPLNASLQVEEYDNRSPLDFVNINYGTTPITIVDQNRPILYESVINDVVLEFDTDMIDRPGAMHGVQYLDLKVELRSDKNELIDFKELEDVAVCPSTNSPRYGQYSEPRCSDEKLALNRYLNKKTYELNEWSKVLVTARHSKIKYGGNTEEERLEIIQKRLTSFDIDVSFPAGLLTKRFGSDQSDDFDNLGGISLAMMAQFTFYHPEKIAIERPYKIGAGFIALNAFNFSSDNDNRDIGVVVLGSLYPRSKSKLTFPLFLGGGYLLSNAAWFVMIGPGIRVSL
ncbi:MAG: hypothetical protein AAGC88_09245 [Bacteroidota bacterium]